MIPMLVPFAIARSSAAHFATGCYVITLPRTFRVGSMISSLWFLVFVSYCIIFSCGFVFIRFAPNLECRKNMFPHVLSIYR